MNFPTEYSRTDDMNAELQYLSLIQNLCNRISDTLNPESLRRGNEGLAASISQELLDAIIQDINELESRISDLSTPGMGETL